HQRDRNRGAPDGVQAQDEQRPPGAHAERREETIVQQTQPEVVRVEQRLRYKGILDDPERETEDDDPGPRQIVAPRDLANKQCAAAIERREEQQRGEPRNRKISEQELADERRQKEQCDSGTDAAGKRGHRQQIGGWERERDECQITSAPTDLVRKPDIPGNTNISVNTPRSLALPLNRIRQYIRRRV